MQHWQVNVGSCSAKHRTCWHLKTLRMSSNGSWGHRSRLAAKTIPAAQGTFRSQLIHGILQVTMHIALRCALHRYLSRDIHHWRLFLIGSTAMLKSYEDQAGRPQPHNMGLWAPPWVVNPISLWSQVSVCEWSFRRFTYGNLVTTSPSSKWYSLKIFHYIIYRRYNVRSLHRIAQSVGATGGVYKGQGHNRHTLMTYAY